MELNTDAHASIAGYYKQIYVAVEQLLQLTSDEDSIGLECGSDVTCFFKDGTFNLREVKFYKDDFHKFSPEICKTIYNFYVNGYNGTSIFLHSNTKMDDFYKNCDSQIRIAYIIECLLRHNRTVDSHFKQAIDDFRNSLSKEKRNGYSMLASKIMNAEVEEEKYMYINTHVILEEFSEKLNFEFEALSKVESIEETKKRTVLSLENFIDNKMELRVESEFFMPILHKLADEFFESCVKNSIIETLQKKELNYLNYNKITVKQLKKIIKTYSNYIDRYSDDIVEKKLITLLEVVDYQSLIGKYHKERKQFKEYQKNHPKFSIVTLKSWLKNIGETFINVDHLKIFCERFEFYSLGLGFIGMLVTEKVLLIDVRKDFLMAEVKYGIRTQIINENLYDIQSVIAFIKKTKSDGNEGVEVSFIGNFTLSHFTMTTKPYVQIETSQHQGLTLQEFIASYKTVILQDRATHLMEILHEIIENQNNIVIFGDVSTNKTRFNNALLNETRYSDKVISYHENNSYKLCDSRNIQHIQIYDVDYKSKISNLQKYIAYARDYDYKFFNLDNYHIIDNSVLDIVLKEFRNGGGHINSIKYSTRVTDPNLFLDDLGAIYKAVGKSVTFANVNTIIFLENCLKSDIVSYIFDKKNDQDKFELLYRHEYIWN